MSISSDFLFLPPLTSWFDVFAIFCDCTCTTFRRIHSSAKACVTPHLRTGLTFLNSVKIVKFSVARARRLYQINLVYFGCLCGSLAQCALSLKRLSAGPGFNPQIRQNKLLQDYRRACFEINFSDRQEGLTVSSIICDR